MWLERIVHSLPKRNGNEKGDPGDPGTDGMFTAYLKGMETQAHNKAVGGAAQVHSLPKRNGNARRLLPHTFQHLVHSLPKRNGNMPALRTALAPPPSFTAYLKGMETQDQPKAADSQGRVHSLPKRNGNGITYRIAATTRFTAYLKGMETGNLCRYE